MECCCHPATLLLQWAGRGWVKELAEKTPLCASAAQKAGGKKKAKGRGQHTSGIVPI